MIVLCILVLIYFIFNISSIVSALMLSIKEEKNTDFLQITWFKESKNMAVEKKLRLTIKFYKKLCLPAIVYKKTDEWYVEWQRVTMSGTINSNEWQRVTKMTKNWSFWLNVLFSNKRGTFYSKPWGTFKVGPSLSKINETPLKMLKNAFFALRYLTFFRS